MRYTRFSFLTLCFVSFFTAASAVQAIDIRDYLVAEASLLEPTVSGINSSHISVRMRQGDEESRLVNLSEKRGKVLVLTTWHERSGASRVNLRQLQRLQRKLGKDVLEVIAIHDSGIHFARVAREMERLGFGDLTVAQSFGPQVMRDLAFQAEFSMNRGGRFTWVIDPKGEFRLLTDTILYWVDMPAVMELIEALIEGDV